MTPAAAFPDRSLQPSAQVQADFFSKLARLQNAILSQQHPRYRLSSTEVEKLSLALKQASFSAPLQPELPAARNGSPTAHARLSSGEKSVSSYRQSNDGRLRLQRRDGEHAEHTESTSPSINPVLLTKSDDLIRAEMNLKRIRIERSLKDSVSRSKKESAKDKDLGSWLGPARFDAAKVLEEAISLVTPQSGLNAAAIDDKNPLFENADNSSEGEASYYSSQANSWTKSPNDSKALEKDRHTATQQNNVDQSVNPDVEQKVETSLAVREPRVSGLGHRHETNSTAPADKPSPTNLQAADATDSSGNSQTFMRDVEDLREESYSPPGVSQDELLESAQRTPQTVTLTHPTSENLPRRIFHGGMRTRESESYSPPPPPEVPVVSNNLSAPVAPQPSRVTPLALGNFDSNTQIERHPQTAPGTNSGLGKQEKKTLKNQKTKEPRKAQNASENGTRRASGQQNMVGSRPKRRREPNYEEENRRISAQRVRASPSPIPYIKQEPLSPPPPGGRSGVGPPRRLVLREDGGADIEVMSPRYAQRHGFQDENYGQGYDRNATRVPANRTMRYVEEEPIVISPSPPVRRRPTRDDGDLRRYASLQHAAGPYSQSGFPQMRHSEDFRYTSTPPPPRQYQYFDDPSISAPSQNQFRQRQSPLVPAEDDYYTQTSQSGMQPPAKRRIVVDQYGNEYIAVPARSTASREPGRASSLQVEPRYFEQGPQPRARPPVITLDEDEGDSQLMPPPQLVPRKRRVEAWEEQPMPPSYYTAHAAPRSASLQPAGRRSDGRYQYVASEAPPWAGAREQPLVRERAYSARPNLAQQDEYYDTQYERVDASGGWR